MLVISKELTRTSASKEYHSGPKLAHVELAERYIYSIIHYDVIYLRERWGGRGAGTTHTPFKPILKRGESLP